MTISTPRGVPVRSSSTPIRLHEDLSGRAAGYLVDLSSVSFSDTSATSSWIQALPLGHYQHPIFGEINITGERVLRFAQNVKNKVRGTDLDIDFDHKGDPSKGNKAAGWIKDAEARADGLWVLVEWTVEAAKEIKDRAWRYFSPEFVDEWEHPKSGEKYKDVLFGGGLTNRPFLKDILPVNLSEVFNGNTQNQEGDTVDRKALCKLLGLSEDASDEAITGKIQQLNETGGTLQQITTALKLSDDDDVVEAVTKLQEPAGNDEDGEVDAIKQLREQLGPDSPAVKLMEQQAQQIQSLTETVTKQSAENREHKITRKLGEIEKDGKVLTPAQVEDFKAVLLSTPDSAHEPVYKLAEDTAKSAGVALGVENGRAPGTRGEETATKRFNDRVASLMKDSDGQLSFGDAVEMVSSEDPQLFNEYRGESYSREEA